MGEIKKSRLFQLDRLERFEKTTKLWFAKKTAKNLTSI